VPDRPGTTDAFNLQPRVIFGAGSFSFGLYCWPLGEVAAVGGALARHEAEAVGGALARHEAEAVGGALARHEAEAVGGALARREAEAVGGALARREAEAVGGALARRGAGKEKPGVLCGLLVVVRVLSETAAGQDVYVGPGPGETEYAGPVAVEF
jgi:hypothetical protein